jgi:hypothetical protein
MPRKDDLWQEAATLASLQGSQSNFIQPFLPVLLVDFRKKAARRSIPKMPSL